MTFLFVISRSLHANLGQRCRYCAQVTRWTSQK